MPANADTMGLPLIKSDTDELSARLEAQIALIGLASATQADERVRDHLQNLHAREWVNPHLPIGWPRMPKGLPAQIVAILQKITRRLLRWYINPLVAQQNEFNTATVSAFRDLYRELSRQTDLARVELDDLRRALERLAGAQALHSEQMETDRAPSACCINPLVAVTPLPSPALDLRRFDALLEAARLRHIEEEGSPRVLLIGEDTDGVAAHAADLGYEPTCLACPDAGLAKLTAGAFSAMIWSGGIWRHSVTECLGWFFAAHRVLVAGAPLVVESVDPADAAESSRQIWSDTAAVRPYSPSLVVTLLRAAGFADVSELGQRRRSDGSPAGWYGVLGYRSDD